MDIELNFIKLCQKELGGFEPIFRFMELLQSRWSILMFAIFSNCINIELVGSEVFKVWYRTSISWFIVWLVRSNITLFVRKRPYFEDSAIVNLSLFNISQISVMPCLETSIVTIVSHVMIHKNQHSGVLLILLSALTNLYLGVSYPTDILGGYILGEILNSFV